MRRLAVSQIACRLAGLCALVVLLDLCLLAGTTFGQQILRFEAEDITEPKDAWQVNRSSDDKWNLWSTDKDAEKKWSGGVVLRSPLVLKDRANAEEGAPPLHSRVPQIPPGKYYLTLGGVGRPIAVSFDGDSWRKIEGTGNLGLIEVGQEGFQLWVDDRFASTTNPGACYYDYLEFTPLPDPNRKPKLDSPAGKRVEEPLGRGLVALPKEGGAIYVGWRLLKQDPGDVAFHVYRKTGSQPPIRLTKEPLSLIHI